ncbi:hypothetical protein MWH25_03445 [Natroniella acetigena]|uniref:hypothetical protein n=1 Tax=Natroniella acetigena TaxID=52004 RepID=UPI00200B447A|nr:hypothetical protein [Natroniella acetigena]MCK8826800.1 hypothetical protein [Natroniella acetigena]
MQDIITEEEFQKEGEVVSLNLIGGVVMQRYILIDNLFEVKENIRRFNKGLKEDEWLVSMLSRFRQ